MVKIEDRNFKDEGGRMLILRGVNLGGSSKTPFKPYSATWNRNGFYDHRNVSFVGRPFLLEEADDHFNRLHQWGFLNWTIRIRPCTISMQQRKKAHDSGKTKITCL
jgi:hypothetical protein